MKINEVVELPSGAVKFTAELTPDQTTAMVRWFITTMLRNGAVKIADDNPEQSKEQTGELH